jgi:uncharacterized protein YjaG (DUF416 family)
MAIEEIKKLKELDYTKQLIFAYLTCERVFPNYIYFSTNYNFGNPLILREAIDIIYEFIVTKTNIDNKKIDSLLAQIHNNTPHTNDFSAFYATIAMYSGGVIFESLNLLRKTANDQILADISTMSIDAIDCFIQERDDMDYTDPSFEVKIQNDILMKNEITIQKGIINYLIKIKKIEIEDIRVLSDLQKSYNDNLGLPL